MSFLDKAKNAISNGFGDETVRIVHYDKTEEKVEKVKKERPPNPEPKPKPVRSNTKKRSNNRLARKDNTPKLDEVEEVGEKESEEIILPTPPPPPSRPEPKKEVPKMINSAFEIDDEEDFFEQKQREYDSSMVERFQDVPEVQVDGDQIQDVLEVLGVQPTFAIEKDIFLPEDLDDIIFDLQAPYGFEQGQVNTFVERTKITVGRYVELLKIRNADVAKLASVVDRLQVDINNLRFQTEISHGINVMPTSDADDIESKYLEAKLKIKRLEERLRDIEHGDNLTSSEREKYEQLQDQFSLLRRENETLQEENYNLKTQIAYMEEEQEQDYTVETQEEPSPFEENENTLMLPEVANFIPDPPASSAPTSSASYTEDNEESSFTEDSFIDLLDEGLNTTDGSKLMLEEDDEDDELDALMRDWNK